MGKIKKGIAALLLGAAGFFGMQQAADIADTAPKDASAHAAVSPETSMVELAEKLGCYARKRDPGFLLVGNGPVGLLEVAMKRTGTRSSGATTKRRNSSPPCCANPCSRASACSRSNM